MIREQFPPRSGLRLYSDSNWIYGQDTDEDDSSDEDSSDDSSDEDSSDGSSEGADTSSTEDESDDESDDASDDESDDESGDESAPDQDQVEVEADLEGSKDNEVCLVGTKSLIKGMTPNTFIADSGASSHMGPSSSGMFNITQQKSRVRFGAGPIQPISMVGRRKGEVILANGNRQPITLEKFKHVPEMWANLFSLTSAMKAGRKVISTGQCMSITKGPKTIVFDRIFKTGDGYLWGVEIPHGEVATMALDQGSEVDINDYHEILNHSAKETLLETAK